MTRVKDVTGRRVSLSSVNRTLKNETLAMNDVLYKLKKEYNIKSFEATEDELRKISEWTGIRYGILEGYQYTDENGEPTRMEVRCKSNGQHYLMLKRQGVGGTWNSGRKWKAADRDEYIAEVLYNISQSLPPYSYLPVAHNFTRDNCDLILQPVVDAFEPINIIISAPVTVRSGSMATNNGCELLKKIEKLPMATRTLVTGVIEHPDTADTVTITPFMHSMLREADIPVVVTDRHTGRPYFVEIEDTLEETITATRNFKISKLTRFESILNLEFGPARITNTETNKPYDLRTKLVVSAKRK